MARRHPARVALAFTLALSSVATAGLGFSATPAVAEESSQDLQAKLDQAKAQLSSLYEATTAVSEKVNDAQYALDQTNDQISQTESDIEQKTKDLENAQATLENRVSSEYKSGGVSLLSVIFSSSSFDELSSRMFYANKAAQSDAETIQQVKDLRGELNQQKAQLEEQKAQQQQDMDELSSQQADLQQQVANLDAYTNSLDQQVKDKLAEEQAAAAAQAQAEAEAAQAQAAQNDGNYFTPSEDQGTQSAPAESNNDAPSSRPSASEDTESSHPSSSSSSDARNTIISAAYSKAGNAEYVWGASGPNSFDCSGFTAWCYAKVGITLPHSSGAQAAYCNKPASQAEPGDIVWRSGHVGIYIGNGRTIEAMYPGAGVTYGSLSSFVSAGSPL